jgi:hypothetical protein
MPDEGAPHPLAVRSITGCGAPGFSCASASSTPASATVKAEFQPCDRTTNPFCSWTELR